MDQASSVAAKFTPDEMSNLDKLRKEQVEREAQARRMAGYERAPHLDSELGEAERLRVISERAKFIPADPFAGIQRPTLDALLNRVARWFDAGCQAGETDIALSAVVQAYGTLLQAEMLKRIIDQNEVIIMLMREHVKGEVNVRR